MPVPFRLIAAAGLTASATALAGLSATAASAQPTAAPAAPHATVTVVARALNTPRGVLYDPATRQVLVAEAGVAAKDTSNCAPADGGVPFCIGDSGAIYSYSTQTGQGKTVVSGLSSQGAKAGDAVLGLSGMTLRPGGGLNVVYNMNGDLTFHDALGPQGRPQGHTAVISPSGRQTLVGSLVKFEQVNNPQKDSVDSDPYGIANGPDGSTYVADAGGNDILQVMANGTVHLLAVLPDRKVDGNTIEAVPTSVVVGPDGALYIGQLSGYPYYRGAARVYRLVPGHQPTIFATGFTNIINMTFTPSGQLLVLEIAKNNLLAKNQVGALYRVSATGAKTLLASTGMSNPGGVAAVSDSLFYVTNRTTGTGGDGQLLKVQLHS